MTTAVEAYPDDRIWTTYFGDVELPGINDNVEFQIAADLCDDHGFELPAKALRAISAHVGFIEPARQYGWRKSQTSHLHFYEQPNGQPKSAVCGKSLSGWLCGPEWYPWGMFCTRCVRWLQTENKYPDVLAAMERLTIERKKGK